MSIFGRSNSRITISILVNTIPNVEITFSANKQKKNIETNTNPS